MPPNVVEHVFNGFAGCVVRPHLGDDVSVPSDCAGTVGKLYLLTDDEVECDSEINTTLWLQEHVDPDHEFTVRFLGGNLVPRSSLFKAAKGWSDDVRKGLVEHMLEAGVDLKARRGKIRQAVWEYGGIDLGAALDDDDFVERWSFQDVLRSLGPVFDGLGTLADRELVHHDVKPSNVLVDVADGQRLRAKLIDFGHAVGSDQMYGETDVDLWSREGEFANAPPEYAACATAWAVDDPVDAFFEKYHGNFGPETLKFGRESGLLADGGNHEHRQRAAGFLSALRDTSIGKTRGPYDLHGGRGTVELSLHDGRPMACVRSVDATVRASLEPTLPNARWTTRTDDRATTPRHRKTALYDAKADVTEQSWHAFLARHSRCPVAASKLTRLAAGREKSVDAYGLGVVLLSVLARYDVWEGAAFDLAARCLDVDPRTRLCAGDDEFREMCAAATFTETNASP